MFDIFKTINNIKGLWEREDVNKTKERERERKKDRARASDSI